VKPIVVLRNEPDAPAGYLGDALDRRGHAWRTVRLDAGEALPYPDDVLAVAVLGGAMGAYDEDRFPFLASEKSFLADCASRSIPVLGICLGCQLLADALGGSAYLAPTAEVVFAPIELTAAGRIDSVVAALEGRRVVRFHQDTFDLPPGVEPLATGGGFLQAFRVGSAIGIQPHPEVTPALLSMWFEHDSARALATKAGTDPDALAATFVAAEAEAEVTAAAVFDAWLDEVTTP
jgi:GMP synthase (glutamine-hydrolysing)